MKLTKENYVNTGGNCMVMYVDVLDGGEIKQFACTDEMVSAINFTYADAENDTDLWYSDDTELWWIDDYSELVKHVGAEIAKQLHETFLKYETDVDWFPMERNERRKNNDKKID